jgi:hypothetical protein
MTNPPAIEEGLTPAMIEAWAQYEPADGFDVANESTYNEVIVHMRHAFMSGMRAALSVPNPDVERLHRAIRETIAEAARQGELGPNRNADQVAQYLGTYLKARAALADRP